MVPTPIRRAVASAHAGFHFVPPASSRHLLLWLAWLRPAPRPAGPAGCRILCRRRQQRVRPFLKFSSAARRPLALAKTDHFLLITHHRPLPLFPLTFGYLVVYCRWYIGPLLRPPAPMKEGVSAARRGTATLSSGSSLVEVTTQRIVSRPLSNIPVPPSSLPRAGTLLSLTPLQCMFTNPGEPKSCRMNVCVMYRGGGYKPAWRFPAFRPVFFQQVAHAISCIHKIPKGLFTPEGGSILHFQFFSFLSLPIAPVLPASHPDSPLVAWRSSLVTSPPFPAIVMIGTHPWPR